MMPSSISCATCSLYKFTPLVHCRENLPDRIFGNKPQVYFNSGSTMFREGDPFRGVYCLKEGLVQVSGSSSSGQNRMMWIEGPGHMPGLESFCHDSGYIFKVVALTPVRACFIDQGNLRRLLKADPSFTMPLMKWMCNRINLVEERIMSASGRKMNLQLAEVMLSLHEQLSGFHHEIHFTVSEYAEMLGTSQNYLYKVVDELQQNQLIELHDHHLVIKDTEGLKQLLGERSPYAG